MIILWSKGFPCGDIMCDDGGIVSPLFFRKVLSLLKKVDDHHLLECGIRMTG